MNDLCNHYCLFNTLSYVVTTTQVMTPLGGVYKRTCQEVLLDWTTTYTFGT